MRVWTTVVVCLAGVAIPAFAKNSIRGEIARVVDTAHLEFEGQKTWNYQIQRIDKTKIVLTVPPFDTATEAKLNSYSDNFINEISIAKDGPDHNYQITFELADSAIESFDYLTDDPSRLIIDFYKKIPEKAPVAQAAGTPAPSKPLKTASAKKPAGKSERKPAGSEILEVENEKPVEGPIETHFGAFDAGDSNFDRFRVKDYEIREDAILAAAHNIYLQFPMLKMPVSHLDALMKDQPEYVIHEKNDRENKEARLLVLLFQRGRANVFLKTFNYFIKKYPDSDYLEILRNMAASIHLNNWKNDGRIQEYDAARDAYVTLIKLYPESPLYERNCLILGYMQLERGEALASLQGLQSFMDKFPKSPETAQVRKAIADDFLILHKYDDGLKEYTSMATDFAKTADGPEARYRLGDVEFSRREWPAAVQAYAKALKELPQYSTVYPNAYFNMAEALFWKKDYKHSLEEYVNFLKNFPTHPYGGYAMTRIGEIMGILGVDPRRPMGAFLESTFRYPENPGAKVARLRMLTQQMKGMRPKDLKKALDEFRNSIGEVHLPGMEEFSTLLLANGLLERGEYTEALQSLLDFYREHPSLINKDQITGGILRSIASEIKSDLDQGKFLDGLKFDSKYSKTWLHGTDRIDIPFFEGRAFEQAGAWDEAAKIYERVDGELGRIAGTREEKERRVAEFLPRRSTVRLRLAAVAVERRKYADAYQRLKELDKSSDLDENEQVERVELIASVSEFRGEMDRAKAALRELIKHWKGEPEKLNPALVHAADLEVKTKSFEAADANLDRVLAAKDLPDNLRAKALELKGDSQLGEKRPVAAIEAYQNLLEQFEAKRPLGSIRYKVGLLLFQQGDLKGAETVWSKLEGGSNEVYWDLAKEKLEHAKWQDEYRKYVKRIPAMNSKPESETDSSEENSQ